MENNNLYCIECYDTAKPSCSMHLNEQASDDLFIKRLMIAVSLFTYLCFGLYWFYPETLNMLFWPFHYGWLAH